MDFTPIDLAKWPRRETFYYFSEMAPTGYSVTVNVDVTGLREKLREKGLKFFPVYLWLVTKCLNEQVEFKVAYRNGVLGYYNTLTPLYAAFHEDDKTFSLMWTEFDEDLLMFHRNYCENSEKYGEKHGILSRPGVPPENAYTVSCLPWVSFTHFSVQNFDRKPYFFPSVEAGKLFYSEGKEWLPLSITCHHATTDGYHVSRFLSRLSEEMDKLRA